MIRETKCICLKIIRNPSKRELLKYLALPVIIQGVNITSALCHSVLFQKILESVDM